MGKSVTVNAFSGLDMRNAVGEELGLACELENMCIDASGHVKKRPGTVKIHSTSSDVDGMWAGYIGGNFEFLFAQGGTLYTLDTDTGETQSKGFIGDGKCCMFEFDRKIYILNGNRYSVYNGSEVSEVSGYIPLIAIGCPPSGGGTQFENVNMLTPYRRQRFSADGTNGYHLAEKPIEQVTEVRVNGSPFSYYTVDTANGVVSFRNDLVPSQGVNNVEITYKMPSSQRECITRSRHAMLFGGNVDHRVFLWGDPMYPNYRYYSELANGLPSAEYFPVNNYSAVGNSEITDIIAQYDRQLIFTKDRAFYSLCELREDALGNYYSSFPVYNLNGEKGSLISGSGCSVNSEPVTLCEDGLNRWVSTLVENEKNAVCFSDPIKNVIWSAVRHGTVSNIILHDHQSESELYFVYDGVIYVYNYAFKVWYRYTSLAPYMFVSARSQLFFAAPGGIYKFDKNVTSDCGRSIRTFWRSPLSHFGEPDKLKDITYVTMSVSTDNTAKVRLGLYDPMHYIPEDYVAEMQGYGIYSFTLRGHKKRLTYAGVCIESNDAASDFTVCSLTVITKTKGVNSKIELR